MYIRERWKTWPWGVYAIALAAVMGGVGVYSAIYYPNDRPSVRLAVPPFALALYWALALLCNQRSSTIDARGVRVFCWPFLVVPPRRAPRRQIQHCYVRRTNFVDDGVLLETYHSVGVETRDGRQIDVSTPLDEPAAQRLARELAIVLNQAPGETAVDVRETTVPPGSVGGTLALAGFWLAMFLMALLWGAAWESRS